MEHQLIEPARLDIVMQDDQYIIYYDDKPLLTPKGNTLNHTDDRLLQNIVTDLHQAGTGRENRLSLLSLLEFRKDYIDHGNDPVASSIDRMSLQDGLVLMKTGKVREGLTSHDRTVNGTGECPDELDQSVFWSVSVILKILNSFIAEKIRNLEVSEDTEHPFIHLLKDEYRNMQPYQKTVVNLLSEKHQSALVLPFLLASGRITASEYARGCMAVTSKVKTEGDSGYYHELHQDAVVAKEFLSLNEDPAGSEQSLMKLIRKGESASLEFKSTLRWDLKTGKPAGYIERACLKTICAFLNTTGGILLIGIRDDGSTEGIESDRFINEDKFLLHLWTLIRTSLGRDVSPYITSRLEKNEKKTICLLTCSRSPRPVFLRQPGFDEEFYIRMGPGSTALDISEALKYIGDRF